MGYEARSKFRPGDVVVHQGGEHDDSHKGEIYRIEFAVEAPTIWYGARLARDGQFGSLVYIHENALQLGRARRRHTRQNKLVLGDTTQSISAPHAFVPR